MTALRTNRVALRPPRASDEAALTALLSDPANLGALPDPADGGEVRPPSVWQQTQAIQMTERVPTGEIVGASRLYDVDPRAGIGWFDVHGVPAVHGRGTAIEGCLLFLEWTFRTWDLRWLCAHVLHTNWPRFAGLVRHDAGHHLGTLRERVIVDGVPEDVEVIGIDRDLWRVGPTRRRLLAAVARAVPRS